MKKIELLAPAGDYECFLAAINAGADAVYLGGKEFGARSFAGNFEESELIDALNYAHLYGRKIYLTCNTLIKEREWDRLFPFLSTLYCNGLDGIIIQDIGLISFLKNNFPDLEIHISTQMTVTYVKSIQMLYNLGVSRIVPARELSLQELCDIKKSIPVELETFAHGAMCYCYSGQCLFSSFLGGRSGNRGKCAQPCRLPYQVLGGEQKDSKTEYYPLSLKDLCTIDILKELIEADISSLKIEGRMKSPQYVAGVTSIYRKYIDEYYQKGSVSVVAVDRELLNQLYIRSHSDTGYYKRYNGKEMITLDSPSYQSVNEQINQSVAEKYCTQGKKINISAKIILKTNENAKLSVFIEDKELTFSGDTVSKAINRPLTPDDIRKQLNKTGNSSFSFQNIEIEMENDCFLTIKQLNELRRNALEELQRELLKQYLRTIPQREEPYSPFTHFDTPGKQMHIHVAVMSKEQFVTAIQYPIERIYLPADLIVNQELSLKEVKEKNPDCELFLSLPRIIRKKDDKYLSTLEAIIEDSGIHGVLINNLEELYWLNKISFSKKKAVNNTLYVWNRHSLDFYNDKADTICAPLELSKAELSDIKYKDFEIVLYGHISMMVTANCVCKTTDSCNAQKGNNFNRFLKDRYKKEHPVFCNCLHCYNEIFNAVPLSLHNELENYKKDGYHIFRLDFTDENRKTTNNIINYYLNSISGYKADSFPLKEYTTGHSTKGAL